MLVTGCDGIVAEATCAPARPDTEAASSTGASACSTTGSCPEEGMSTEVSTFETWDPLLERERDPGQAAVNMREEFEPIDIQSITIIDRPRLLLPPHTTLLAFLAHPKIWLRSPFLLPLDRMIKPKHATSWGRSRKKKKKAKAKK